MFVRPVAVAHVVTQTQASAVCDFDLRIRRIYSIVIAVAIAHRFNQQGESAEARTQQFAESGTRPRQLCARRAAAVVVVRP
jgi:hypothetical protein